MLLGVCIAASGSAAAAIPLGSRVRVSTSHRSRSAGAGSVSGLTTRQLAGQLIVYSYPGLVPPHALLARIEHGEAAGVVFFGPNIASRSQLRAVANELQAAARESPLRAPLLLMTDQEGGRVRRLPGAPELSEKEIGDSRDALALAGRAGAGAAANLASAGLNVNLAPVLDVARTSGGFIGRFERSYGSDPRRVGELGKAFITASQRGGVAATAKHFPGLGAASRTQDTDEREVVLHQSLGELRAVDEVPYHAAISAGVRLVMLSWAIYPALDPRRPAGLSRTVIEGELRQRLGFRGVTLTDSLGAGALRDYGGFGERALLAAGAGADLILCSAREAADNTPSIGGEALNGIATGMTSGKLSRTRAEAAAAAVLALRRRL